MVHIDTNHTNLSVPAPQIFTYGTASDPQSPSHDSSSETVTPEKNPMRRKIPTNPVSNIPNDPDSDPILSDFSLSDSSDPSDNDY